MTYDYIFKISDNNKACGTCVQHRYIPRLKNKLSSGTRKKHSLIHERQTRANKQALANAADVDEHCLLD